ncbi:MAG TPA: hypothetical protein PK530_20880, partial [Anaerolineales bacterium]|nr:hypothetical protein [Anaerolineales bacterium]
GLLVLGARWGVSHEKRILAVLFFIGSILFLLMSINMSIGFNNSFPSLSDLWLQNMAMSRAHTRYRDQRIVSIQGDSFVANLSILEAKYVD